MKASEIREKFLTYFESKNHTQVTSSSLVPANDPTMLLTNSGMVQFKDVFLGTDKRAYTRAASVQRCVRAGGKHNDLENVGYTARHHTFFEMLGNFSFGDYFKRDAIQYAWELLTKIYGLPEEKLCVTVYEQDDEAYQIWADEIGVPKERIIRIGDNKGAPYASDNFWQMADTGPCGPCSEIFYDHGEEIWGGPPGSPEEDGDRFIEVWNLVFMQFIRDEQGNLSPLPMPCVDTGMGLERLAAVLQHVHSNYEIDLFQNLIKAAAKATNTTDLDSKSLRVIADHIRASAFMIVDGLIPSSDGHGYVLRRIIRRALRHGHKLGQKDLFFYELVDALVKEMGDVYPELKEAAPQVKDILRREEERFGETLEHGMKILELALVDTDRLDGETAFTLYDTYGFPLDLTADICREKDVALDEAGFDVAMERQKATARAAGKFKMVTNVEYHGAKTQFVGNEKLQNQANVLALYVDGEAVDVMTAGQEGIVILDVTAFYAESGGQAGDVGTLQASDGIFAVGDTQKIQPDVTGHYGALTQGSMRVGDSVTTQINENQRVQTVRNHSATHLMHKALREVLGAHVAQKGSLVDADKTRFDFSHHAPVTPEQIRQVEDMVNAEILNNQQAAAKSMSFDDAIAHGAMALFGEKYGDEVRVVDIGSSCELCGGTHVDRTGDIGPFKIVSEGGVAAGIRRVEAVTGLTALRMSQDVYRRVADVAAVLKTQPDELVSRLQQVQDHVKALEKELATTKAKLASNQGDDLLSSAIEINGVKVLAAIIENADVPTLRTSVDQFKDKLKTAAVVLASVNDGKISLIAGVTNDTTKQMKAGDLVNFVAKQVGGKGGGRPDMAQAGGTEPANLDSALASVADWAREKLA